jgi:hypothetical protein
LNRSTVEKQDIRFQEGFASDLRISSDSTASRPLALGAYFQRGLLMSRLISILMTVALSFSLGVTVAAQKTSYKEAPGAPNDTTAAREFRELMQAVDYSALSATLPRWKAELAAADQKEIIVLLLRGLGSEKKLPQKRKVGQETDKDMVAGRHDLLTESGRSGWALEQLLKCDLRRGGAPGEKAPFQQNAYQVVIRVMNLPYEPYPELTNLSVEKRVDLANQAKTSELVLERLAYDVSSEVRLAAAKNRRTSVYALALLREDPDARVRAAALENSHRHRQPEIPELLKAK